MNKIATIYLAHAIMIYISISRLKYLYKSKVCIDRFYYLKNISFFLSYFLYIRFLFIFAYYKYISQILYYKYLSPLFIYLSNLIVSIYIKYLSAKAAELVLRTTSYS